MGLARLARRRAFPALQAYLQLACACGHALGTDTDEPVVLEWRWFGKQRLAAVSFARWCDHAGGVLHRHRPRQLRYQPPWAPGIRRGCGRAGVCDPGLGQLSGCDGLCRAADEPVRTDHRLLHRTTDLRSCPGHPWYGQGPERETLIWKRL